MDIKQLARSVLHEDLPLTEDKHHLPPDVSLNVNVFSCTLKGPGTVPTLQKYQKCFLHSGMPDLFRHFAWSAGTVLALHLECRNCMFQHFWSAGIVPLSLKIVLILERFAFLISFFRYVGTQLRSTDPGQSEAASSPRGALKKKS